MSVLLKKPCSPWRNLIHSEVTPYLARKVGGLLIHVLHRIPVHNVFGCFLFCSNICENIWGFQTIADVSNCFRNTCELSSLWYLHLSVWSKPIQKNKTNSNENLPVKPFPLSISLVHVLFTEKRFRRERGEPPEMVIGNRQTTASIKMWFNSLK